MNIGALAPRWRRVLAAFLDLWTVAGFGFVLVLVTGAFEDAEDYVGSPWPRVFGLGVASYFLVNGALMWWRGQTLGKAALRVTVVRAAKPDQELDATSRDRLKSAPFWRQAIRAPFFIALYGLPLGGLPLVPYPFNLFVLLDLAFALAPSRRCLHDLASGTEVRMVNRKRRD